MHICIVHVSANAQLVQPVAPVPLVCRWIDYTNKHGFGAQFSDGHVWVWFIDGSSLSRV